MLYTGDAICQDTKWRDVEDYKSDLRKKMDSLNYIEGIWEVNFSTYNIDLETGMKSAGSKGNYRIAVIKRSNEIFYTRKLILPEYISNQTAECCDFIFETTADKNRYILTGFWCDIRKIISKENNGDFIFNCRKNYTYFDVITNYTFTKIFPSNIN